MQEDLVKNVRALHGVLMTLLLMASLPAMAAVSLGGSVIVTSDYLVRGISRNHHDVSAQGDVHIALGNGFDAGVFAAMVQIAPNTQRNTEVSAFVGFAADLSDAWHARTVVNHYSYPWNSAGSKYDYDELSLDVAYQQWLTFSAVYSPNAPRYLLDRGIVSVTTKSAEISAQAPLSRQFFLTSGLGYAHLAGPNSEGYNYWSVGGVYSLGPVAVSLQYVSTSSAAQRLYYDSAAHNRVVGTAIWRF